MGREKLLMSRVETCLAPTPDAPMTIASWLLDVEPGCSAAVRAALAVRPGVECRSETRGTLVVLTETPPDPRGLEPLHDSLRAVPGVLGAALVASYQE
jgi:nitrate reductase NapAB chaperone NapD